MEQTGRVVDFNKALHLNTMPEAVIHTVPVAQFLDYLHSLPVPVTKCPPAFSYMSKDAHVDVKPEDAEAIRAYYEAKRLDWKENNRQIIKRIARRKLLLKRKGLWDHDKAEARKKRT